MEYKLVQEKLWSCKVFTLQSDRIIVEDKDLRQHTKTEIPLDQLGFDSFYKADNKKPGKIALVITILIAVASFTSAFLECVDILM